jgi:histidinol-phosphate aminotransferase
MSETVLPVRQSLNMAITRPSRERTEIRPNNMLWLDKNENMDPQYHAFIAKLIDDLPAQALYGYPDCHEVYVKLARYLSVAVNQLIFAAGSDGIIRLVYEAFINPGDTVIYTEPTFAMYSLYAQMYGAKSFILHYEPTEQGPYLNVDTVISAIKQGNPRLVCLPNPNSPSGTVFSPAELKTIIQTARDAGAIMLIDEAYHPFYMETAAPWVNEFPNLIVARTFSKAWGCAGIRLGYGLANAALTDVLHKLRPMYEAGALSFTIADRLLDYPEEMEHSVTRLNAGKEFFLTEMQKLRFQTFPAQGNFLHVNFGGLSDIIHQTLSDKVLYRQNFSHPSLAGFSRFSATTATGFLPLVTAIQTVTINNEVLV